MPGQVEIGALQTRLAQRVAQLSQFLAMLLTTNFFLGLHAVFRLTLAVIAVGYGSAGQLSKWRAQRQTGPTSLQVKTQEDYSEKDCFCGIAGRMFH
jgi:hypothetical protein